MDKYFTIGHRLPRFISAPLFGDRQQFGLQVQQDDPCWLEWQAAYLDFYYANQKKSVGDVVNTAGYKVMEYVDLIGKRVLEIGPGDLNHHHFWRGKPEVYVLADIQNSMLERSQAKLTSARVNFESHLLERNDGALLPFDPSSFDVVVSFYSLEHLFPLEEYLVEILRVLKTNGLFIGAIPCEGGLAWGGGRFLTSRRWLRSNTTIDPDKIICWEHPNFADGILAALDKFFCKKHLDYWTLKVPAIDLNLVAKFVYEKK